MDLCFYSVSLQWVRPVLSCHKHLISRTDGDWKNTIDWRAAVSLFGWSL